MSLVCLLAAVAVAAEYGDGVAFVPAPTAFAVADRHDLVRSGGSYLAVRRADENMSLDLVLAEVLHRPATDPAAAALTTIEPFQTNISIGLSVPGVDSLPVLPSGGADCLGVGGKRRDHVLRAIGEDDLPTRREQLVGHA